MANILNTLRHNLGNFSAITTLPRVAISACRQGSSGQRRFYNIGPRKFFDSSMRMVVVASRDIAPGEEVTLSYTPPLTSTPVRQVLFVCGQAVINAIGLFWRKSRKSRLILATRIDHTTILEVINSF